MNKKCRKRNRDKEKTRGEKVKRSWNFSKESKTRKLCGENSGPGWTLEWQVYPKEGVREKRLQSRGAGTWRGSGQGLPVQKGSGKAEVGKRGEMSRKDFRNREGSTTGRCLAPSASFMMPPIAANLHNGLIYP